MATLNGHMTLGAGGPAVRRGGQVGKESLVTFLVHLWLGKTTELSTETYKIPFLVFSTKGIIG